MLVKTCALSLSSRARWQTLAALFAAGCSAAPMPAPEAPTSTEALKPRPPEDVVPSAPAESRRPALENYEPRVKADNITALDAARLPFARYLVAMHNRIHPIFAEQYRAWDSRPKGDGINDATLSTSLEIVLDKTGKIVRMGVTRTSGNAEFDVAALNVIRRAEPFGPAPEIIASPDGNVYLHWEFRRDPIEGCTTRNVRPYLLRSPPTP